MAALLLAELSGAGLSEATARALAAAVQLGGPVDVLVAGSEAGTAADAAAALEGVARVLRAEGASLAGRLAEPMAVLILALAPAYDALVAPATAAGKDIMPRVAALLDVMQVSDVTRVVDARTFERPIYAGNAVETVRSSDATLVLTVRASAFRPAGARSGAPAPIESVAIPADPGLSTFAGEALSTSLRPDLGAARVVVAGGRALGSKEAFERLLAPLAERLGAAIGASRAAVDAGYAPNELQVGQTGRAVAPDLYIAIGISGAIQHLAGMKDSRVIVAINKDAEAPILAMADYSLVGDLFELVPALEKALGGADGGG